MGKNWKDKLEDFSKFMRTPRVTPIAFIVCIASIIFAVFTETDTWDAAEDFAKTVIYISVAVTCVFAGIKLLDIEKIGDKFKNIWDNKKISTWEKIRRMLQSLAPYYEKIGELFDLLNEEQFKKQLITSIRPEEPTPEPKPATA